MMCNSSFYDFFFALPAPLPAPLSCVVFQTNSHNPKKTYVRSAIASAVYVWTSLE